MKYYLVVLCGMLLLSFPMQTSALDIDVLRTAAVNGDPAAQNDWGRHLITSRQFDPDYEEAINWFRASAQQGYPPGQTSLAECFFEGNGTGMNIAEAIVWYSLAADKGYNPALIGLGECYLEYSHKNYPEAMRCFRAAADAGSAEGDYMLGYMYEWGLGVTKDWKEAANWWIKPATAGHVKAQGSLGDYYLIRQNPPDVEQGLRWLFLAAGMGDLSAVTRLAYYYEDEEDHPETYYWYLIAGALGERYPQESRERAASYLLPEEIEEIRARAERWFEDYLTQRFQW
jgi:TPR repeat protein